MHATLNTPHCLFCGSNKSQATAKAISHRIKRDHGPFDFYSCKACGSGFTFPLPDLAVLSDFYSRYDDYRPAAYRQQRERRLHTISYDALISRIPSPAMRCEKAAFAWLEVGAGHGEMSVAMAERFPHAKGSATDFGPRPEALKPVPQVSWFSCDVNASAFSTQLGGPYDLIFANNVWEHVLSPHAFATALLSCLAPHGTLYLVTPNYNSIARHLLGSRWPFWLPGEHLSMPTVAGARACLINALRASSGAEPKAAIAASAVAVPYNLSYVLATVGLSSLSHLIGKPHYVPLPIGVLEASVSLQ